MSKQQIIHNKWSYLGITLLISQYDFDGWIDVNELEKSQITSELDYKLRKKSDLGSEAMLCRPKSLQGIENNNGWVKIESEDDLPNTDGKSVEFWFLTKHGNITTNCFSDLMKNKKIQYSKVYSHYQPIEKPKPPLY